jgi:hypothetical protein
MIDLTRETRWVCPHCTAHDVTREAQPHSRFHTCRSNGLTMPFVEEGTRCKVEVHERDDYVGGEIVTKDGDGRPVMNVITTRDDGTDCAVYAPCATFERGEH